MNLTRITRLLKVLRLLQAGRGHNARSLAQICGVTRRTVFRDLETLREAGVPLVFDGELERYHVPGDSFLPPTTFTAAEALSMIALCHEVGGSGHFPFFEAARTAALKLECSLPARLRAELSPLTRAIRVKPAPVSVHDEHRSNYEQLVEAIAARKAVRIRYRSLLEDQTVRTKLRPYQMLFSRRSWYVIGRSSLHRQSRTFHVGRISELTVLDESFRIPRGFSIERYLRNAWSMIPEAGPDYNVTVRFTPLVARNVAEVNWHKTQHTVPNDDGTLDFHVTVSGLGEISWWILGYGDQAEVIKPPALRQRIADCADRMARTYRQTHDTSS